MTVLLDTHAWVWSLTDADRLTDTARNAIATAEMVYVSPISLFEIAQKTHIGKWPELKPHLALFAADQQAVSAPLSRTVAVLAGSVDWAHRDPFDRIIAATAMELKCPLVSKDREFDGLDEIAAWRGRIWSRARSAKGLSGGEGGLLDDLPAIPR